MFMCMQEARVPIPVSLLPKGAGCWSVIHKELFTNWFIVTFDFEDREGTLTQTVFISEADCLKAFLGETTAVRFRMVQWMTYDAKSRTWFSSEIDEVWNAPGETNLASGRVVIHCEKGYHLADEWAHESILPQETGKNWTLLYGKQYSTSPTCPP